MYCLVYTPPSGQPCGPPSSQQWNQHPPQQVAPCPPIYPRLAAPPRAPQLVGVGFSCFKSGQIGTFSHECPQPQLGFAPRAPPPPIGHPKVVVCPSPKRVGHANFTILEEIPLGAEVLDSMFCLYEYPIIILFDSRASLDFLSLGCAQKAGVTLYATQMPYSTSTPGGRVAANQMSHKIPLELVG
jgi:hypothetical protein